MFNKILISIASLCLVQAAVQPVVQRTPPVVAAVPAENPEYSFAYDVQDTLTGDSKRQTENRNGDVVTGEYSLNDPDGTRRIVQYRADPVNGFVAVVRKEPLVAALTQPAVGVVQQPSVDSVAIEAADLEPIVAAEPQRYVARQRQVIPKNEEFESRREPLDPKRAQTKNSKPAKLELAPEQAQGFPVAPAAPVPVAQFATNIFSAPYVSAPVISLPRYSAPYTYSTVTVF
ncbi:uncharacterized protein [Diabrotica undecimpunctata]|uniref:uncharacterized protein n=1 Tax=Diabrotica undecimpunctata TaxID=50387 RepID=UPI003B634E75